MPWDDDAGYDTSDPKHPDWGDRMLERADIERKREKEQPLIDDAAGGCGHDGWQAGCSHCEAQERVAREAMGDA